MRGIVVSLIDSSVSSVEPKFFEKILLILAVKNSAVSSKFCTTSGYRDLSNSNGEKEAEALEDDSDDDDDEEADTTTDDGGERS